MAADIDEIIMKSCDLPTIPTVAGRVIQLVADPNTTADMLNKAISADQAMAARVLKLANSSFYGCLRSIKTLTQAIMIIGFSTIKNIVLAASTKDVYKRFGLTEKMLHEHSFGAAISAHGIAREIGFKNTEEAFLVGLLHDIGKVILNNNDPDRFMEVMQEVYNGGSSFSQAEKAVFGFTHSEVGGMVVRKWQLSPEMEKVVRFHHSLSALGTDDPYVLQLTAIVNLADATCHKLGIGVREPRDLDLSRLKSSAILKLGPEKLAKIEETVKESYEEGGDLIS